MTGNLKIGEFNIIKNSAYNTAMPMRQTAPKLIYQQVSILSKICFIMSLTILASLLFLHEKEDLFFISPKIAYIFPTMGILLIILYMLIDKFDSKISSHQNYKSDDQ